MRHASAVFERCKFRPLWAWGKGGYKLLKNNSTKNVARTGSNMTWAAANVICPKKVFAHVLHRHIEIMDALFDGVCTAVFEMYSFTLVAIVAFEYHPPNTSLYIKA